MTLILEKAAYVLDFTSKTFTSLKNANKKTDALQDTVDRSERKKGSEIIKITNNNVQS